MTYYFGEPFKCTLKPWMPGGVHPAQIVMVVRSCNQSAHSTFSSFEQCQILKPSHDCRDCFVDHLDELLSVHFHRLTTLTRLVLLLSQITA